MKPTPGTIPAGAVDLGDVKARADARDAALRAVAEKRAMEEAQALAEDWDRKMNRAFKGIVSRPQRHALLSRIRQEDEDGD